MAPPPLLFTGLPPAPRRRKYFLISFVAQVIVYAILIKTGVLNPPAAVKRALGPYVKLVAPAIYTPRPPATPPPVVIARARIQPSLMPPAPVPQPPVTQAATVKEQIPDIPRATVEAPKAANVVPPSLPKPTKKVVTGEFSGGSSALANSKLAASKVQTGGFGDPSGVVPNPNGNKNSKLAQVGSFDLPAGSGTGNGAAGAHGAVAVVASAGFGNGVSTMDPSTGTGGVVRNTGFGDMEPAASPSPASRPSASAGKLVPAEVLSKPTPVYSEEARRLKIEGEVLLKVDFSISGTVRVLGVERGLGHGLDEAAIRAAQGMKFKPAMRDGKPVDSIATVHVLFQLT